MPTLRLQPNRCEVPVILLRINNKEYTFLVDTGATRSVLHPDIVQDMKPIGHTHHKIHGGMIVSCTNVRGTFNFAGAKLHNIDTKDTTYLTEMFGIHHTTCGGIIGQDILRQFKRVVFDYVSNTVTFEI